jgi:hypothetical protein
MIIYKLLLLIKMNNKKVSEISKSLNCDMYKESKDSLRNLEMVLKEKDNLMKKYKIHNEEEFYKIVLLNKYFDLARIRQDFSRYEKPFEYLAKSGRLSQYWRKNKKHSDNIEEIVMLVQHSLEGDNIKTKDVQKIVDDCKNRFDAEKFKINSMLIYQLICHLNKDDSIELLIAALALFRYGKHHGSTSAFASLYIACKFFGKNKTCPIAELYEHHAHDRGLKPMLTKLNCVVCKKVNNKAILTKVQDVLDHCTSEKRTKTILDKLLSSDGEKFLTFKNKPTGKTIKTPISDFKL